MIFNRLEVMDRQVTCAHMGTEIVTRFYVEPYSAYSYVLQMLLGSFAADGTRIKPACDSFLPDCYCDEATVEPLSTDLFGMGQSLTVEPGLKVGVDWTDSEIRQVLQAEPSTQSVWAVNGAAANQQAGAVIRAVYHPLITEPLTTAQHTNTYGEWTPDAFDFVDPQLHPLTKVVSCGAQLKYLLPAAVYPKVGSEGFVTQPMQQFSIRRIQVKDIPVKTINRLLGKVNAIEFGIGQFVFPPATLRFDEAQVEKRAVPKADGTMNVWYDIMYLFTWNTIYEEYWQNVYDEQGVIISGDFQGPGYVGWNRVLGSPSAPIIGLPINPKTQALSIDGAPIAYYETGWKSTNLGAYRGLYLTDIYGVPINTQRDGITLGSSVPPVQGFYRLFDPQAR